MQQPSCLSCCHFRRHFVLSGDSAIPTNCGHCVFIRRKHRRPDTPACPEYRPADVEPPTDREKVIHYLTTELLDYVLHLPLPPKIEG